MSPSAALDYLAGSLLFIVGVIFLLAAAWLFARALAEVSRARVHRASAEAQVGAFEAADDAIDDIHDKRRPVREPSDDDLRQWAKAGARSDRVTSTMQTDNGEEEPAIPPDRLYIPDEDEAE